MVSILYYTICLHIIIIGNDPVYANSLVNCLKSVFVVTVFEGFDGTFLVWKFNTNFMVCWVLNLSMLLTFLQNLVWLLPNLVLSLLMLGLWMLLLLLVLLMMQELIEAWIGVLHTILHLPDLIFRLF